MQQFLDCAGDCAGVESDSLWQFGVWGSSFGFSLIPFAGLSIRFVAGLVHVPVVVGSCGNQSGHFKSFQSILLTFMAK